jgi:mRNA interferase RelE/StbE
MVWRIEFLPAAEKELAKLDRSVAQRILAFLDQRVRVAADPRSIGEALVGGKLGAFWKYRVGDYRLIVSIEDQRVLVNVVRVAHRSAVYHAK